jgi:hypothetical protein
LTLLTCLLLTRLINHGERHVWKLASDPIHFVSASPSTRCQFFFRKYRRYHLSLTNTWTLRFSHTRSTTIGYGIRLLQRLGFLLATASANVGVKYLLEKRQDRHEVMSTGSQSGYAAEMSNNKIRNRRADCTGVEKTMTGCWSLSLYERGNASWI